jgi:nicotinamide mononucleotide (NMN) deamidase PncC
VTGTLRPDLDEDGNRVGLIVFGCSTRNGKTQIVQREYSGRPHDQLRRVAVLDALVETSI